MGTFTKIDISVDFNTNTPEVFKDKDVLKEALIAHYRAESGDEDRVDMFLSEMAVYGKGVEFTVSSENERNAEFQMERALAYLRENHPEDVTMFSASAYQAVDHLCISLDDWEWKDRLD